MAPPAEPFPAADELSRGLLGRRHLPCALLRRIQAFSGVFPHFPAACSSAPTTTAVDKSDPTSSELLRPRAAFHNPSVGLFASASLPRGYHSIQVGLHNDEDIDRPNNRADLYD
ncbi:hypothetical protein KSP39_PZI003628 [Platanthera zijinensis]|uniref:Uncharacterized protein n=1 Tax=Platanthera zijinensis TaxID=2320716 RepID=A0AAP0GC36_9ASPA